ncbi:MAG: tetratricopeptide repeat protein, partial [Bacteroidota bacterium]
VMSCSPSPQRMASTPEEWVLEKHILRLEKRIKKHPDWYEPYLLRGQAHYKLSQYRQARENFDKVLEILPQHVIGRYNRAMTYINMGQRAEAIADFQQILTLDSLHKPTMAHLGFLYVKMDSFRQAVDIMDRAVRHYPQHIPFYSMRGAAFFFLDEPRLAIYDYSVILER